MTSVDECLPPAGVRAWYGASAGGRVGVYAHICYPCNNWEGSPSPKNAVVHSHSHTSTRPPTTRPGTHREYLGRDRSQDPHPSGQTRGDRDKHDGEETVPLLLIYTFRGVCLKEFSGQACIQDVVVLRALCGPTPFQIRLVTHARRMLLIATTPYEIPLPAKSNQSYAGARNAACTHHNQHAQALQVR